MRRSATLVVAPSALVVAAAIPWLLSAPAGGARSSGRLPLPQPTGRARRVQG